MKKSPERSDNYSPCGLSDSDDYRPTWKDYKTVIEQARKLHGEAVKPVVHPHEEAQGKHANR